MMNIHDESQLLPPPWKLVAKKAETGKFGPCSTAGWIRFSVLGEPSALVKSQNDHPLGQFWAQLFWARASAGVTVTKG